jgi:hypothetical protein
VIALEQELQTYNRKLPDLLQQIDKFVLIKESTVEGVYDTYIEALRAGYQKHGPDARFLVKRIAPAETVSFFTRDFSTECQA